MPSNNLKKNTFKIDDMSLFFNNVDGFLSKRTTFLNSWIASAYDIFIFQECNVKDHHRKFDDWAIADLNCLRGGDVKPKYARTKKFCSLKDAQSNLQDMFQKKIFDSGKKRPSYAHSATFGPLFFQLLLVSRFSQAWLVGKD